MSDSPLAALTLVTPTCGRASLAAAIDSVAPHLTVRDQLLVVGDGHQPYARRLVLDAAVNSPGMVAYMEATHPASVYGNHQRDVGMQYATGTHLCFLDDDDVYRDGALDLFRDVVSYAPAATHVFRAEWGPGHHWRGVLWSDPVWRESNVATCMVVVPNWPGLPRWMEFNDRGFVSDFGWMSAAVEGTEIVFHREIVADVRPEAWA